MSRLSPTPPPTRRAARCLGAQRAAFTLMEVLVASALGVVVATIVVQAYQGLAKSQGLAQGTADLRTTGTAATERLYRDLKRVHRLFTRANAGTWLGRMPIQNLYAGGASPVVEPGPFRGPGVEEFVLPAIFDDGQLSGGGGASAPVNYEVIPSEAGNALLFTTLEGKVDLVPTGTTPGLTSGDRTEFLDDVFGPNRRASVNTYRLHLLFVARKPVGRGPEVRPGSNFTYTAMHWTSQAYADFDDCEALADTVLLAYPELGKPSKPPKGSKKPPKTPRQLLISAAARGYTNALLATLGTTHQVAGILKTRAPDGSKNPAADQEQALHRLACVEAPGALPLTNVLRIQEDPTSDFATGDFRSAIAGLNQSSHAAIDLAFNTDAGGPFPGVQAGTLRVPMWGDATTGAPYGFECVVVGPLAARQLTYRITLRGRTLGARSNFAQAFQQVVSISEE